MTGTQSVGMPSKRLPSGWFSQGRAKPMQQVPRPRPCAASVKFCAAHCAILGCLLLGRCGADHHRRGRAMQYVAGGILEHAAKAEVRRSRLHEGQKMIPRRSGNAAHGLPPMGNSKLPWLQVDRARRRNGSIDQIYQDVLLYRYRREAAHGPPMIEYFDGFHDLNSQM